MERPSSLLDAAPRRRTSAAWLDGYDTRLERRSIMVGMLLTVFVWLFCFFLFTLLIKQLGHQHTTTYGDAVVKPKQTFDIEIQPDEFLIPKKPPQQLPEQFVETNPDAPENVPDNTRNFGAQNQQVAQETPTPDGKSDRPATEGKQDWESNQIVSGRLAQPQIELPPEPPPMPEVMESAAVSEVTPTQREQNPLPGDKNITGESPTGYGSNDVKVPEKKDNITPDAKEVVKGLPNVPDVTGLPQMAQPRIDPKHPQPRQRVERNVRPAVLAENKFGTQNIGAIAFDARWSNYGQYLQKLIDTVQIQWERLLENSKLYPPTGTKVTIKFRLGAEEGAVTEIVEAEGNGGKQATAVCQSAITDRSPYGKWTDDMVAILGDSQELTFTFYFGMP